MMTALVFPGQGSQKIGMALNMIKTFPWAAKMAQDADKLLNRNLTRVIFEGPEVELKETVNTQPALFLTEAILADGYKKMGLGFDATAGHSLGEYSALYAAKAASFEDLLKLVDVRARAMSEAVPPGQGAMAAVLNFDQSVLEKICQEVSNIGICVLANLNCPGQIVISGAVEAVKKVGELAKERGAKRVLPLEVSGPFHSPLMKPAREKLASAISSITFFDSETDVYQNVDGNFSRKASVFKEKLLSQLTGSVQWELQIKNMCSNGVRTFMELGPGKALSGLIRKINPDVVIKQAEDPDTFNALIMSQSANLTA
ncbi:MAG: ACP S-malonyltransferase [Candidatus Riflebacteria bacterium]|nr:ACP S-malonyltransferase [Candidatus Riflebacteria bacterium]